VATGIGGLEIFATHDGSQVNFFVTPPKAPANIPSWTLQSIGNRLVAQLPAGNFAVAGSSECGFMRVDLNAQAGAGQMASVLATAFLPPQPDPDAAPEDEPDANLLDTTLNALSGGTMAAARAVRTRPLLANLSVSQLTTETAPLISISFGWAGRDQQQRF
jgi:hypothetical protein